LEFLGTPDFIGLQPERFWGNYARIRDKIFEGMTVEQIHAEAVRLESEREKERMPEGSCPSFAAPLTQYSRPSTWVYRDASMMFSETPTASGTLLPSDRLGRVRGRRSPGASPGASRE
jgi:hypothetical protein